MRKASFVQNLRTSVKLSLQFSLLYTVLSAIVFAAAYWFTYYELQDWVSDQMLTEAETLAALYEEQGPDALTRQVDALADLSFENTRIVQLLNSDGNVLAGTFDEPLLITAPGFFSVEALGLSAPLQDEIEGYWIRSDSVGPFRLVQGSGDHLIGEILEALSTALLVGFPCVVGLGLIVGVRVGRLTETRITEISSALSQVSQGQLGARVAARGPFNDDLTRVSVEINAMLDQVARLLESQEQISNDIAHDMRTPLQRLRQRLEAMRDSPRPNHEDIDASLAQTDDIISTFNALLRIAQIEAVNKTERFEPVLIGDVMADVADAFEPIAEDQGMTIALVRSSPETMVKGDRALLSQLVVNLIENAINHCPRKTHIDLSVSTDPDHATLTVSDNGPGIDKDIREKVLQRFFRAESSRHSEGNGLGLALVKAIADIHGAKIEILNNTPGTKFCIRFPRIEA